MTRHLLVVEQTQGLPVVEQAQGLPVVEQARGTSAGCRDLETTFVRRMPMYAAPSASTHTV